nr:HAD domain-containing protein [Rhodoferax sp.]
MSPRFVKHLDFDGVLHHENVFWHHKKGPYLKAPPQYSLFQHSDLLVELLDPYPQLKIVLSTSWARVYGCDKAAKRLPESLRSRVIGATFHSRMFEQGFLDSSRGMQIWSDVTRRNPKDWLALDDDWLGWPRWAMKNCVKTHEHEGISNPAVKAELIEKLKLIGAAS